jgi:hypothetical protein
MEVRRTAPVKLDVPDQRREDFHESAQQFLHCANRAAAFCWDDTNYKACVTANSTARNALYDELRASLQTLCKKASDVLCKLSQAVSNAGNKASV